MGQNTSTPARGSRRPWPARRQDSHPTRSRSSTHPPAMAHPAHHDPAHLHAHALPHSSQALPPASQQQPTARGHHHTQVQQHTHTTSSATLPVSRRRRLLRVLYPLLPRNRRNSSNSNHHSSSNNSSTRGSNIDQNGRTHSSISHNSCIDNNRSSIVAGVAVSSGDGESNTNPNNNGGSSSSHNDSRASALATTAHTTVAAQADTCESGPSNDCQHERLPERPPRPPPSRPPPLHATPTFATPTTRRTPGAVPRVRHRYDERSIRSSSSRSSSLLVASSSSSATAAQSNAGLHSHLRPYHSQDPGHHHHLPEPAQVDQVSYRSSRHIQSEPQPTSEEQQHDTREHFILSPDSRPVHSAEMGLGARFDLGMFVRRSNPRGGTSISSSLMPIRPDSEDEDEEGFATNEQGSEHGVLTASSDTSSLLLRHLPEEQSQGQLIQENAAHSRPAGASGTSAGTGEGTGRVGARPRVSRPSRYPPPEIVVELIQRQFMDGMAESAAAAAAAAEGAAGAGAATTPVTSAMDDQVPPHLTSLPSDAVPGSISESLGASSVESAGQEARAEATMDDGHSQDGSFGVHRRRLRSSSLRGLLGFQFTGNAGATRERVRGTGIDRGFTPVQRRSRAQSSDAADAPTQNPFVRLLNEIGRGVRGQQNNGQDGANGQTNGSTLPTNATRQNRRHTTIHLIHIGGGTFEAARRGSGPTTTTTMTTGTPSGDRPESPAGTGEITDAILMFLSNPRLNLGANGEHLEDTQISNGGTTRPRSRGSPLVVVLSGAPGTCKRSSVGL
ncbi:hypothetical protein B0O80DRAFT_129003 [Mortierella sp. GBAus27b]|nr:hypothetical protein B0O80DRAFT_129003 [Mortierella sp. GBAus27b]